MEEGGREEAPEGFEDKTAVVRGGDGKGHKIFNHGTVANVLNGGDNLLDGAK